MWCKIEEIRPRNVSNVQGRFVAQRMTNIVGADSVHDFVRSSKLQAITWAWPLNFGLDIDVWARGDNSLGGQSSIGVA